MIRSLTQPQQNIPPFCSISMLTRRRLRDRLLRGLLSPPAAAAETEVAAAAAALRRAPPPAAGAAGLAHGDGRGEPRGDLRVLQAAL